MRWTTNRFELYVDLLPVVPVFVRKSARMFFDIVTPLTCSKPEPTCGRYRFYSAIGISRPLHVICASRLIVFMRRRLLSTLFRLSPSGLQRITAGKSERT